MPLAIHNSGAVLVDDWECYSGAMPKKRRHPGGRPAERFKFGDATFAEIATKVSRTPKPAEGWPTDPDAKPTKRRKTK